MIMRSRNRLKITMRTIAVKSQRCIAVHAKDTISVWIMLLLQPIIETIACSTMYLSSMGSASALHMVNRKKFNTTLSTTSTSSTISLQNIGFQPSTIFSVCLVKPCENLVMMLSVTLSIILTALFRIPMSLAPGSLISLPSLWVISKSHARASIA